jgi:ribosomal protein S12 methylthiotransferase accessory factor
LPATNEQSCAPGAREEGDDVMFATMNRPYKESTTRATINTIRRILKNIDLVPEETFHGNPFPQIYSASIELPPEKGGFRTNGKGRTKDFCLASAYAEYMERMQNLLFANFSRTMMSQLKTEFGFFYDPEETCMNQDEFCRLPDDILSDFIRYSGQGRKEYVSSYFKRVSDNGMPGVASLPFFDTMNQKIQFLPINLLLITVGSNGMAAGNTQAEATFQAICELMERWSAALVFYRRLIPPTVPLSYLRRFGEEAKIIRNIEADGKHQVIVKDFSAGMRIPSLGVIIKNCQTGKYRLNVGSDTSFQVALSRCLTEIFQGIKDIDQFEQAMLPIPDREAQYFTQEDQDAKNARFLVFTQFTKDGSGQFPISLFAETPDYQFNPDIFAPRRSYEEEVKRLIGFIHDCGKNVYIRDVSFLGFPSVFVYVPDVSAQGRKTAAIIDPKSNFQSVDLDGIETSFFNLNDCNENDLARIIKVFETFPPSTSLVSLFNINLLPNSPWNQLSLSFFLSQLCYHLGQYQKSQNHFQKFLQTRQDGSKYYQLVARFLDEKVKDDSIGADKCGLLKILDDTGNGRELAEKVIEDMAKPYFIEQFTKLPKCPECGHCPLETDCLTPKKLFMARKIYAQMEANSIDQTKFSWVMH